MTPRIEYRHGRSPDALDDMPDACAALIATDPPYGLAREYGRGEKPTSRAGKGERWGIMGDDNLAALHETAPTMARLLAPGGVALVCCAPTLRRNAERCLEAAGLVPLHVVVWDKGAPGMGYGMRYAHEDVILATPDGADPFRARGALISPVRAARVQDPEHPNEKPVALWRKLITWACPDGGLVVDPFAGIASCGVAAVAQGCDYVGVELDPAWWPIAERRLADVRHLPHPSLAQGELLGGAA